MVNFWYYLNFVIVDDWDDYALVCKMLWNVFFCLQVINASYCGYGQEAAS